MKGNYENSRFGSESTSDQLARTEQAISRARAVREQAEQAEARAMRESLEKLSSSSGARRSFCDILNGYSRERAPMEGGGLDLISEIRKMQHLGRRTHTRAHDAFEKAGGLGNFNRLHPLRRATPVEAGGSIGEARLPPQKRSTGARSNFEVGADDPGQRKDSRFDQGEKYTPPERVSILGDSAGSLRGGHGGGTGGEIKTGANLQAEIRAALAKPVRLF